MNLFLFFLLLSDGVFSFVRLHNHICVHVCAYLTITMMMNDLCFFISTIAIIIIVVCKGFYTNIYTTYTFCFSCESNVVLVFLFFLCYNKYIYICVCNEIIRNMIWYFFFLWLIVLYWCLISIGNEKSFFLLLFDLEFFFLLSLLLIFWFYW